MGISKGQATLRMNFAKIHRGHKNGKSAIRPFSMEIKPNF